VSQIALRVACPEGVAVYLNGVEIFRRRLVPGAIFDDFAVGAPADEPRYWFTIPVSPLLLKNGTNIIAAEVHVFDVAERSLTFDLQLVEGSAVFPAGLTVPGPAGGTFNGEVHGASGLAVPIDSSIDLRSWRRETAVVLTNGLGVFSVPATNAATFFRIHPQ
jgi:hypothetical protein